MRTDSETIRASAWKGGNNEPVHFVKIGDGRTSVKTRAQEGVLKAIYLANTPRFSGGTASGRRCPAQVFFAAMNGQSTSLTDEGARHANVLVDITPVVDRKIKAMDCLQSQYYPGDLARKVIEDVNGRMGLHARMPLR